MVPILWKPFLFIHLLIFLSCLSDNVNVSGINWSEWRDLNPQSHGPEPCVIPNFTTFCLKLMGRCGVEPQYPTTPPEVSLVPTHVDSRFFIGNDIPHLRCKPLSSFLYWNILSRFILWLHSPKFMEHYTITIAVVNKKERGISRAFRESYATLYNTSPYWWARRELHPLLLSYASIHCRGFHVQSRRSCSILICQSELASDSAA